MDWIALLISFLVFAAIVVVVVYGVRWLMGIGGFPPEVQRIVMIVLALVAIIVFLLRFVQPLVRA